MSAENNADFGIESLDECPVTNRGYSPMLPSRCQDAITRNERRQRILDAVIERTLTRPDYNLERNAELDDDTVYELGEYELEIEEKGDV